MCVNKCFPRLPRLIQPLVHVRRRVKGRAKARVPWVETTWLLHVSLATGLDTGLEIPCVARD